MDRRRPAGKPSRKVTKTIKELKLLYTNARSIILKRNELLAYVVAETPDIVSITESWVNTKDKHLLAEIAIPGYKTFLNCRTHKAGGGVILYIKENLQAIEIDKVNKDHYDSVYAKIKLNGKLLTIGTIYRPPKSNAEADCLLYDEIKSVVNNNNDTIICGDFNLPHINWNNNSADREGMRLLDMVNEVYLNQVVREPTRDNSILDLVFTTDIDLIDYCDIGEHLANSDHRLIRCGINCNVDITENRLLVPNYNKADFTKISRVLSEVEWIDLLNGNNAENMCNVFTNKLQSVVEKHVPMVRKRLNNINRPSWMNNEIQQIIGRKRRAYKVYKRSNADCDSREYNDVKRRCKGLIKSKKREYEEKIAKESKSNPKRFFQYVRSKKNVKTSIGPLKDNNNILVNDNKSMAFVLNEYFNAVFIKEDETPLPEPVNMYAGLERDRLVIGEITVDEISKYLLKLDPAKSVGVDEISPRLLRECHSQLSLPLKIIFNKSLCEKNVPSMWKLANVTPIFKKGSKSLASNYRPISLTSVIVKLFEKILRDKIVSFLDENNSILNSQHGFRNKRSCLTNLLDFFNVIYSNWDAKIPSDVIYLDFQKAFDTVPHKRLLTKLRAHGIGEQLCSWIGDWLSNRKQRVVINGEASDWLDVTSGVPQGSVLGPTLFLIYINDLDCGLVSKISKFADDTKLGGKAYTRENCELIQSDLDKLSDWSDKWLLKFNSDKCKVMHIGNDNLKYNYQMQNKSLTEVQQEKDLGVIISNDLKTSSHCLAASKKANMMLGFIKRNFEHKTPKVMTQLYTSLVRPHLEYAVQFWSPCFVKDQAKLESVQRRATKQIPSLRNSSYEERLRKLNMFSLKDRRIRGDLIETFKILKGFDVINQENLFELSTQVTTRNNGLKLNGQRCITDLRKNYFNVRVVDRWNKLPANVVGANTITTFKNRLDAHCKVNGY